MNNEESIEITGKIVALLAPHGSEDRMRIVRASLVLLGETTSIIPKVGVGAEETNDVEGAFPPKAKLWMKKYSITPEQLAQVFQVKDGQAEIIAGSIPGPNKKVQTLNAYVLTGIGALLSSGEPSFDDKAARSICELSGCLDSGNHAATLRDKGDRFTGSKDKGWILTAPGHKLGAELVKELNV